MYLNHKKIQIVFILLNIYSISKSYFKLKQKEKSFTHIPIAFSIDNLFTYPLIVLLTSILYKFKAKYILLFSHNDSLWIF
jgi:hypothetical protein